MARSSRPVPHDASSSELPPANDAASHDAPFAFTSQGEVLVNVSVLRDLGLPVPDLETCFVGTVLSKTEARKLLQDVDALLPNAVAPLLASRKVREPAKVQRVEESSRAKRRSAPAPR